MNTSTATAASQSTIDALKVIEAARFLFLRHGFDRTSVRDIAFRSGCSVGSVNNVGDKGSLYLMAMADLAPEPRLLDALADVTGTADDFEERLWGILEAELAAAQDNPARYRVMASLRLQKGLGSEVERSISELVVVLARKLCRRWERKMPDDDALTAAWAVYTGFMSTWQAVVSETPHVSMWLRYLRAHLRRQCTAPRKSESFGTQNSHDCLSLNLFDCT